MRVEKLLLMLVLSKLTIIKFLYRLAFEQGGLRKQKNADRNYKTSHPYRRLRREIFIFFLDRRKRILFLGQDPRGWQQKTQKPSKSGTDGRPLE